MEVFKFSSYHKVSTLIQSLNLVYLIFNFKMYSLVIKTETKVIKAALDDITTPELGFSITNILGINVEQHPFKISVIINNTFFLFKLLYFSL